MKLKNILLTSALIGSMSLAGQNLSKENQDIVKYLEKAKPVKVIDTLNINPKNDTIYISQLETDSADKQMQKLLLDPKYEEMWLNIPEKNLYIELGEDATRLTVAINNSTLEQITKYNNGKEKLKELNLIHIHPKREGTYVPWKSYFPTKELVEVFENFPHARPTSSDFYSLLGTERKMRKEARKINLTHTILSQDGKTQYELTKKRKKTLQKL